VHGIHLDAQRVGQERELALADEGGALARQRDGAQHGRVGPVQSGPLEGLGQDTAIERGVVGHEHSPPHALGQLDKRLVGGRGGVDHGLGDPGEALDTARQGLLHPYQRLPAPVQLPAADQHGADLGQLASIPGAPIGLGVHGQVLDRGRRLLQQLHGPGIQAPPADGLHALLRAKGGEGVLPRT
jgi:hypothetical protein